jgi:Family of unknown function (DUF6114)
MPAHARKSRGVRGSVAAARRAGRSWRLTRPFWGALITLAGAAEIAAVRLSLPVHSPWTIVPAGVLIAAGIAACGLLLLFGPVQRSVYATVIVLLAILALTTSHLGGYLAGTLLAGAGGATAFAWVPTRARASDTPARPGPPGFTLILGEADGRADRHRHARPYRPAGSDRPADSDRSTGSDRPADSDRSTGSDRPARPDGPARSAGQRLRAGPGPSSRADRR